MGVRKGREKRRNGKGIGNQEPEDATHSKIDITPPITMVTEESGRIGKRRIRSSGKRIRNTLALLIPDETGNGCDLILGAASDQILGI